MLRPFESGRRKLQAKLLQLQRTFFEYYSWLSGGVWWQTSNYWTDVGLRFIKKGSLSMLSAKRCPKQLYGLLRRRQRPFRQSPYIHCVPSSV
uniref:Transposase n=1 Tax=Plectus sambesii TaxID=2011161 RepID=A0A914VE99_9BILA